MTLFGKLLAFLNLVIGLGLLSWSVSVYFQRPSWFDPIPDAVDKGNTPLTFAQLKQEVDAYAKSASAATVLWGKERKVLEDLEKRREVRLKGYEQRLGWAKTGNPNEKLPTGQLMAFFEPVYEKDALGKNTHLLDLTKLGKAIVGAPKNVPLQGADTLLANLSADVKAIADFEKQIEARIKEYTQLNTDIAIDEARLLKMIDIRSNVQAELFYLSSFEVNVYETRETVFRRKKQLVSRLTELGGVN